MSEASLQQHFFESGDLQYLLAERWSRPLTSAAQSIAQCMTSGGRVFTAGVGLSGALASYLASRWVHGWERERPPLCAQFLDIALAAGMQQDPTRVLAVQLQALGHPGDMLVVLSASGRTPQILAVIEAAQDLDIGVIAFTGEDGGTLSAQLSERDIHLRVPHTRAARIHEAHLLGVHALCDEIDQELLGAQDGPALP